MTLRLHSTILASLKALIIYGATHACLASAQTALSFTGPAEKSQLNDVDHGLLFDA